MRYLLVKVFLDYPFRSSKVAKLDDAIIIHEHISALQVPVYDPVGVEVVESLQDLVRVEAHQLLVEGDELVQELANGTTGDVFKHDVDPLLVFTYI